MPALAAKSAMVSNTLRGALRVAVELLDARVDDLERGRHVVGGPQDVEDRHAGPLQRRAQHEGQFHLHARRNEALEGMSLPVAKNISSISGA